MKTNDHRGIFILLLLISGVLCFYSSCRKDDTPGKVTFFFEHKVRDAFLAKDSMIYINAAGNPFEVNELQYFLSEITLWKSGSAHTLTVENGIHYIDIDIPSSLSWSPEQEFPAGEYDSVSFVFGINEAKNKSGLFVNPPERDMFWPEMMGGGYHLMKMNGKWKTPEELIEPFNMHLGIGMIMDSLGNESFVQNCFTVTQKLDNCYISGRQLFRHLVFTMDIESWFETPLTWDWNSTGGQIMQYQALMHSAALNGRDALSVRYETANPE